jgi:aspartate aminotransferase
MTSDPGMDALLRPLEEFSLLHGRTVRRFGAAAIDLSYPNPRFCGDDRAYQLLGELAGQASVSDLQYTPFGGLTRTRRNVAGALARRFGLPLTFRDIVLTPGAAAALRVACQVLFRPDDRVIIIVPCWMDYPVYLRSLGVCPAVAAADAGKHLDSEAIEAAWTPATRGVIISQPACPTGVVYTEHELQALASLLNAMGTRYGRQPVLISDEVHRDTVWSGAHFTTPLSVYPESLSVYSFGKAWSMQGQRTGYIALSPGMSQREAVAAALERAMRVTGHCAPTALMQQIASRLASLAPGTGDLASRQLFTRERLAAAGYEIVPAEATGFVYIRSPDDDEARFAARAADHGVLVMPSGIFHEPGYFRIALNVGHPQLDQAIARLAAAHAGA